MTSGDLRVRRASDADLHDVLVVAAAALGWPQGEPHEELFRWKHVENPFGRSPMWVAEDGDRIAGFRAFMRWELREPDGGVLRAVRAVDTATHPDYQRRGVFSTLTRRAVDEMIDDGIDIVFNTPNDQSRPGYLKLGWIDVGRLPVLLRPSSLRSTRRLLRARVPAAKWSNPSTVGVPAPEALADSRIDELLSSAPPQPGLSTRLSADTLRWRYGLGPLHYRAWAPDGVDAGVVLFRERARGDALECAVGHVLVPAGDHGATRSLLSGLARATTADYLLAIGRRAAHPTMIAIPGQGPRLTARRLVSDPPPTVAGWSLALGDIELF